MIGNQIYLTKCTKALSVHGLLQAYKFLIYLVSTGTTISWRTVYHLQCSQLLFQCVLHYLPTANTTACLLPFSDLHPISISYGFPATLNLSLKPSSFAKIKLIGYSFFIYYERNTTRVLPNGIPRGIYSIVYSLE
jgi:hypothetical protein